jgi:hypothetical protein
MASVCRKIHKRKLSGTPGDGGEATPGCRPLLGPSLRLTAAAPEGDEPLAREREPIERVRARLEALVMANAAPAAVLDPSGQASPAERQPCRTAGARFTWQATSHDGNSHRFVSLPSKPEAPGCPRAINWSVGQLGREVEGLQAKAPFEIGEREAIVCHEAF